MAAATSGEILVSKTVHDLMTGSGSALQDRGTHRLKGIQGDWQLLAVADH
jgi:class 3 adenylate cyclase